MHVRIDRQLRSEVRKYTNLCACAAGVANSAYPRRILNFTAGLVFAAAKRAASLRWLQHGASARLPQPKTKKPSPSRAPKSSSRSWPPPRFNFLLTPLDLPLLKVGRNLFSSSTPDPLPPKYSCDDLSQKLTVVVTVKDACSQMPGFVKALEPVVGTATSLILTYPNLTACDPLALEVDLAPWRDVTTAPLPPSSSPMRGWSDSVGLIKTEFALLLRRLSASDLSRYAIDATMGGLRRVRASRRWRKGGRDLADGVDA